MKTLKNTTSLASFKTTLKTVLEGKSLSNDLMNCCYGPLGFWWVWGWCLRGGCARWDTSNKQSMQVSMTALRPATTSWRHCHMSDKISGDVKCTYQLTHSTGHRNSSTNMYVKCGQYDSCTRKLCPRKNLNELLHTCMHAPWIIRSLHIIWQERDHLIDFMQFACIFDLTMYMKCDKSYTQYKRKEGKNLRGQSPYFNL